MSFDISQKQNAQSALTTFSGSDIKAYFENLEIGNLQGISWSVNREVRPVFAMGNKNVLSYSKGKRGIAGSLILTVFDRDAFHYIKKQALYMQSKSDLTMDSHGGRSGNAQAQQVGFNSNMAHPAYSDQIPPFNCTLVGANEFGASMVMRIHGIHIVSEGQGISVDDNVAEAQFTFVAHSIDPWTPLDLGLGEGKSMNTSLTNIKSFSEAAVV